jgi:hypothetical protein
MEECGSVSVRSFRELGKLKNCTAILGNLDLVFPVPYEMDYSSKDINDYRFPLR